MSLHSENGGGEHSGGREHPVTGHSSRESHGSPWKNCREAWEKWNERVRSEGTPYHDQEARSCRELRDEKIEVSDPSDSHALVTALRRSLPWLYPEVEELQSVIFSTGPATYDYSYAAKLFGPQGQIDEVIVPLLRKHPETRRAVITLYEPPAAWQGGQDKRNSPNSPETSLETRGGARTTPGGPSTLGVPSILAVQFRLAEGGLDLSAFLRSCDVFLGLPANFVHLTSMQGVVAEHLGARTGSLKIFAGSLHWVDRYEEVQEEVIKKLRKQWSTSLSPNNHSSKFAPNKKKSL